MFQVAFLIRANQFPFCETISIKYPQFIFTKFAMHYLCESVQYTNKKNCMNEFKLRNQIRRTHWVYRWTEKMRLWIERKDFTADLVTLCYIYWRPPHFADACLTLKCLLFVSHATISDFDSDSFEAATNKGFRQICSLFPFCVPKQR